MADIISLSRARKAKVRADKEKRSDDNRIRFGRTKAEKSTSKRDAVRNERLLDGHQRAIKDGEE